MTKTPATAGGDAPPSAADIAARIAEAEARLRAALLGGADTGSIRAEIGRLKAEHERAEAARNKAVVEAEAERDRLVQEHVEATAAAYAAEAVRRLHERLAALTPPHIAR